MIYFKKPLKGFLKNGGYMKDKRNYLKVASIFEIVYVIGMFIYYLFFKKFNDEVIANSFLLIISLYFSILLFKESKKSIDELKKHNIKIRLISVWLFMDTIIPGILGFMFVSSLNEKKKIELPIISKKEITKKDIIKSILTIFIFVFIMFVLPLLNIRKKVFSYIFYIIIFLSVLLLQKDELKEQFLVFKSNFKKYIPFIFKRYIKMLGIMLLVAVPIVLLNKGDVSSNQKEINVMFKSVPFITFILTVLYAPFVEESIFRLSLSKLIKNGKLFIIISGFLFGLLHMVDKFTSFYDLLYVFQYSALGICLAKAFKDSNNIFVPMSMHFIQNFIASILVLLLY